MYDAEMVIGSATIASVARPPHQPLAGSMGMNPWPPGAATGIGSWPGTDVDEAVRIVLGELPDLPYLRNCPRGALALS